MQKKEAWTVSQSQDVTVRRHIRRVARYSRDTMVAETEPRVTNDAWTFKYYLIDDTLPVRVSFDEHGLKRGAEVPDAQHGSLVVRHTMMSKIETYPWITEIDRPQFDAACAAIYARRDGAN
jgi:hypothetical protein